MLVCSGLIVMSDDTNGAGSDGTHNRQTSSASSSEEQHQDTSLQSASVIEGVGNNKTPNSYKYPLLKQYYEFGPWIGRNRKAQCRGCQLKTSSSQPDRLLKHLNRCTALTESDKVSVTDLMNERTANKRKKPVSLRLKRENDDDTYYGGDEPNTSLVDDLTLPSGNASHDQIPIPPGGLKKLKRDHTDKNSQIDEALTRFIMMCRIPLKAIHSQEFIELTHALNPDYHIPSRETITNVLIPGLLNII